VHALVFAHEPLHLAVLFTSLNLIRFQNSTLYPHGLVCVVEGGFAELIAVHSRQALTGLAADASVTSTSLQTS